MASAADQSDWSRHGFRTRNHLNQQVGEQRRECNKTDQKCTKLFMEVLMKEFWGEIFARNRLIWSCRPIEYFGDFLFTSVCISTK